MRRIFVDSNVFLSYFRDDDERQSAVARTLLTMGNTGEAELFCGPPVFFEVAWVLSSTYKLRDEYILDALDSIFSITGLTVLDKELVAKAINISRKTKISFADSYIAATAEKENFEVATFNKKHFERFDVRLTDLEASVPPLSAAGT